MKQDKRNTRIAELMSESDSNSGNYELIRLIRSSERKTTRRVSPSLWMKRFPLVWWY